MNPSLFLLISLLLTVISTACGSKNSQEQKVANKQTAKKEVLGNFNADSAYHYVERQLECGPRVPGSSGHKVCAAWLEHKLRSFNPDTIIVQKGEVRAYTGERLPIINIMASYNRTNMGR